MAPLRSFGSKKPGCDLQIIATLGVLEKELDVGAFKEAFDLGAQALGLVKSAKDLLPSGPDKDAATKTLEEAEKAFRIAEAKAAQELGYEICQCEWPPNIKLLSKETKLLYCPVCDESESTSPIGADERKHLEQKLSPNEHNLLKCLAENNDNGLPSTAIAAYLEITLPKAQYYLEKLENSNYVWADLNMIESTRYYLTQLGREYLVNMGDL